MDDILTVLPFQNTIDLIEIKGEHLRESFEFAVQGYDPKGHHLAGKFLQVSGKNQLLQFHIRISNYLSYD
jgi:2',3'-cyclic-nucleotide 2'-phosphodiesterase (5'-nucleotidase family)